MILDTLICASRVGIERHASRHCLAPVRMGSAQFCEILSNLRLNWQHSEVPQDFLGFDLGFFPRNFERSYLSMERSSPENT